VLLKLIPDFRGRRAIGRPHLAGWGIGVVGGWGIGLLGGKRISSITPEEHGGVLTDIVFLIISGHPAHAHLVVLGVVKLPVAVDGHADAWRHPCRLRFLDGCHNPKKKQTVSQG
jgi:hypothetical protein